MIEGYEFGRVDIQNASVRLRLGKGARESIMIRGRAPRRVRRGKRVRVRLTLQRLRGRREHLTVLVRVPRSLKPGRRTLTLKGTVPRSFEEGLTITIEQALRKRARRAANAARRKKKRKKRAEAGKPRTIDELAQAVAALGDTNGITATFGEGRGEQRVFGDPTRLVRGKIRVKVRVLRGHRRHRRR